MGANVVPSSPHKTHKTHRLKKTRITSVSDSTSQTGKASVLGLVLCVNGSDFDGTAN